MWCSAELGLRFPSTHGYVLSFRIGAAVRAGDTLVVPKPVETPAHTRWLPLEVDDEVASGLGAADQDVALGGWLDRFG
jgi:hypothetical protein